MKFLKLERDRWVFRPQEEGSTVEIEIYYTLGGMNYLSGNSNPRGVGVSIRPVKLERSERGSISRSYVLLGSKQESGVRLHVLDLARKSERQLTRVAEMIDLDAPAVASLWMEGAADKAIERLRTVLASLGMRKAA